MIRLLPLWLASCLAIAGNEPLLVESKVQSDIENSLSRVIAREQFLVQVTSKISMRTERKLVDSETTQEVPPPPDPTIDPMPGFLPEFKEKVPPQRPIERKVYRMIETPELAAIRAHVVFDDALASQVVLRAKMMVQNYMRENYPTQGLVTFEQSPMLKPPKEPEKVVARDVNEDKSKEKDKKPEEPKVDNKWGNFIQWGLLSLMGLFLFLIWLTLRTLSRNRAESHSSPSRGIPQPDWGFTPFSLPPSSYDSPPRPDRNAPPEVAAFDGTDGFLKSTGDPKKDLLRSFIARPEAFRLYFGQLPEDQQGELYAALQGPALEKLFEGLDLSIPTGEMSEPTDAEEKLAFHSKSFDDFVRAKEWQDKQFFGFLNHLSDDNIVALASFESPLSVCVMLRYLKPNQSAAVLDRLPPGKRLEVLTNVPNLSRMAFTKIAEIERGVRTVVQRRPKPLFGSPKDEIDFWGKVLIESQFQEDILGDLEKTQPEIYPKLAKFRFKLEDAAVLPEDSLKIVLGESDNDELSLALSTCSDQVAETLLDAVPANRRQLLARQLVAAKRASDKERTQARATLSKRFREILK